MTRQCRRSRLPGVCAAVLLSSSACAFTTITPTASKSSLTSRSAVIQRYRVENESSDHVTEPNRPLTDVYNFLPARSSSIERMDHPSQFRAQVLEEDESLVVVRFYAEACPSCRATGPLFRRWSRGIETTDDGSLSIKILEMPLNRATSSFLQDELQVDRLPYCHLYHPDFGLVEEQVVMKEDFKDFVHTVDIWSKGGCDAELEGFGQPGQLNCELDCEQQGNDECLEFC